MTTRKGEVVPAKEYDNRGKYTLGCCLSERQHQRSIHYYLFGSCIVNIVDLSR